MPAAVWIFVSKFTRRKDQRRRLRLPVPWRVDAVQDWLLYPGDLIADAPSKERTLCLAPADAQLARTVCETLKLPPNRPRTLATAVEALRAVALRRGREPTIVSPHRISAEAPHLALSPSQLSWLRPRSRSLVLTGEVTTIRIWSEEAYANWERSVSRPTDRGVHSSGR